MAREGDARLAATDLDLLRVILADVWRDRAPERVQLQPSPKPAR